MLPDLGWAPIVVFLLIIPCALFVYWLSDVVRKILGWED